MALLEASLASLVGGPQGTVFLGEAQGPVGHGFRGDFRKRSETFEMAPLDAPIASLVAGPRATVLQGRRRALWTKASGGDPTGEFTTGLQGGFRVPFEGTFSKNHKSFHARYFETVTL